MEAVAANSLFIEGTRQSKAPGDGREVVMERSIKASDLRQPRTQPREHAIVDQHRCAERSPAVHDAMAGSVDAGAAAVPVDSGKQVRQKALVIESRPVMPHAILEIPPRRVDRAEPGLGTDRLDLAAHDATHLPAASALERSAGVLEQRELEAR